MSRWQLKSVPAWLLTIVLIPDARLPLMRARVIDGKLKVVQGDEKFNDSPIALKDLCY